jgi:outer membrane receptor for Fe3+-dicitrate
MGGRFLVIGTISLCLVPASDGAQAQDAQGGSEVLPAIEVVSPTRTAARPARNRNAPRTGTRNVRRVFVYPTAPTPTAGSGMDVDKVPASVNAVGAGQIERTGSLNIADTLQQQVPGIIISDTTGNPFMPDIQFRGFVASPVAGTPQGLAVYQNGVRVNEAFGDTVNWDLIPTAAIRSVTVVTNNPAFGLNALGGAVNVLMKDGFNYKGAEINTMGGSFGRLQSSAQWGKQIDNFAVYGALEGVRDNGFRNFS